jgi:hypothetical protein
MFAYSQAQHHHQRNDVLTLGLDVHIQGNGKKTDKQNHLAIPKGSEVGPRRADQIRLSICPTTEDITAFLNDSNHRPGRIAMLPLLLRNHII